MQIREKRMACFKQKSMRNAIRLGFQDTYSNWNTLLRLTKFNCFVFELQRNVKLKV